MTRVTATHHYRAWCREHNWYGPLRYSVELAERDVIKHDREEEHPPAPVPPVKTAPLAQS